MVHYSMHVARLLHQLPLVSLLAMPYFLVWAQTKALPWKGIGGTAWRQSMRAMGMVARGSFTQWRCMLVYSFK